MKSPMPATQVASASVAPDKNRSYARVIAARQITITSIAPVMAISLLLGAAPAEAATIVVTSNADPSAGGCTLREAVTAVNNNAVTLGDGCTSGGPGAINTVDLIGRSGTITLSGTQIDITKPVTIIGPGQDNLSISANNASRIFHIAALSDTTVSGLTLTKGHTPGNDNYLSNGGAIRTLSSITLTNCTVSDSSTVGGSGGGLYVVQGSATLINSTVSGNSTAGGAARGGGIAVNGEFTASLNMTNSTVSGNSTSGVGALGGGLALGMGGGITATLVNSTVSGNTTTGGGADFGGIFIEGIALNLTNSTVAFNTSASGTDGISFGNLNNSLIVQAGPGEVACQYADPGAVNSLATDVTCTGTATSLASLKLGPLANNGGPTQTHALLPGSVAIDATISSSCGTADQRGAPRPQDGDGNGSAFCDVGAYERTDPAVAALNCPEFSMSCFTNEGPADVRLRAFKGGQVLGLVDLRRADVDPGDIVDPGSSPYRVCAYVDGNLVGEWGAAAGNPNLKKSKKGDLTYASKTGGLARLVIRPGVGKGLLQASLTNAPALPLDVTSELTAQFINNQACWGQTWTPSQINRNDSRSFTATKRK